LILRAKSVNLQLAAHFAKRNTKNCGGEKARAGREFLSPLPPFLPAPPEHSVLVSAALRAAINRDFARNRFELRPVIATKQKTA